MTFSLVTNGMRHVRPLVKLVRLRPFDSSTPEGRADERHRRAALTALAMGLAKLTSITTALISVPLTLQYLGAERYGMWMTMSSVVAMLNFADFGMGSGIVNAVSVAYGKDDKIAIRQYVSSGYFALSIIAFAILVAFFASYIFVPWYSLFNVTLPLAQAEAGPALAILVGCFALNIPLGIVQRVQLGMQRGFMASLWQCAGSLMGLVGVVAAVLLEASLPVLVLAYVGGPLVAASLNTVIFFGWIEPRLVPAMGQVVRGAVNRIARIGTLFFVLQLVGAVLYSSDNIVIAQILGATAVTSYAVPQRMFNAATMVLSMALAPLWPAYGEAISRGDHDWVSRTIRRSFLVGVGFAAVAATVLVSTGNVLIHLWVGNAVTAPLILLIGLGVWQVMQVGGGAASMYLNGANVIGLQVAVGVTTAVLGILLKIYLVPIVGVAGVVWATAIAYGICTGVPTYLFLRRTLLARVKAV